MHFLNFVQRTDLVRLGAYYTMVRAHKVFPFLMSRKPDFMLPTFDMRFFDDLRPTGHYFRFGGLIAFFVARGVYHREVAPFVGSIGIFDDRVYYSVVGDAPAVNTVWCFNGNVILCLVVGYIFQKIEDQGSHLYALHYRVKHTNELVGLELYSRYYNQFGVEGRHHRFHPLRMYYYTNDTQATLNPERHPLLDLRAAGDPIQGGFEKRQKETGEVLDGTEMIDRYRKLGGLMNMGSFFQVDDETVVLNAGPTGSGLLGDEWSEEKSKQKRRAGGCRRWLGLCFVMMCPRRCQRISRHSTYHTKKCTKRVKRAVCCCFDRAAVRRRVQLVDEKDVAEMNKKLQKEVLEQQKEEEDVLQLSTKPKSVIPARSESKVSNLSKASGVSSTGSIFQKALKAYAEDKAAGRETNIDGILGRSLEGSHKKMISRRNSSIPSIDGGRCGSPRCRASVIFEGFHGTPPANEQRLSRQETSGLQSGARGAKTKEEYIVEMKAKGAVFDSKGKIIKMPEAKGALFDSKGKIIEELTPQQKKKMQDAKNKRIGMAKQRAMSKEIKQTKEAILQAQRQERTLADQGKAFGGPTNMDTTKEAMDKLRQLNEQAKLLKKATKEGTVLSTTSDVLAGAPGGSKSRGGGAGGAPATGEGSVSGTGSHAGGGESVAGGTAGGTSVGRSTAAWSTTFKGSLEPKGLPDVMEDEPAAPAGEEEGASTQEDASRITGIIRDRVTKKTGAGILPQNRETLWLKCLPNPLCISVSEDSQEYVMLFWLSSFVFQICVFQALLIATFGIEGLVGFGSIRAKAFDAQFFELLFGFYPTVKQQ